MAVSINAQNKKHIFDLLQQDRASNFGLLQYWLKQILGNRQVDFESNLIISPDLAWELIAEWGRSVEGNLPIGDRGHRKVLATRLLGYIETNLVGKSSEAAASYYAMLEQAKQPFAPAPADTRSTAAMQDALLIRKQMFAAIEQRFLGRLSTEYEKSRFLSKISDLRTRSMVAAILAADSINLRNNRSDATGSSNLPEHINQLLLSRANDAEINNVIHRAYSQAAESELSELIDITNQQISQSYPSEQKYLEDVVALRSLPAMSPTLADLPSLVALAVPTAPIKDREILVASLRKSLINAARGGHKSGHQIAKEALAAAGLDPSVVSNFDSISSYLEEVRLTTSQQIIGGALRERNPRILATFSLAAQLGVSPEIPWLSQNDLNQIEQKILANYNTKDPLTALEAELKKGAQADLGQIGNLKKLIATRTDFAHYQSQVRGNPGLAIQDMLAKIRGNALAIRSPYDHFIQKIWHGYDKVEDVLNWPANTALNAWEKILEKTSIPIGKTGLKFSILNPVGFLYDRWIDIEKGIALRTFKWSNKLARSGAWYSGGFRQVADFSRAFFKADASWGSAGSLFVERKWGNVLNWAAQKANFKSFEALRLGLGQSLELAIKSAGNKIAAGLGDKIATMIGAATSEAGIGLLILGAQVAWEVGKAFLQKVKDYLGSVINGDADNLFGLLPLIKGTVLAVVNFVTLGIPLLLTTIVEALHGILKVLWDSLVAIFLLALTFSFSIVFVVVLFFFILQTTARIDVNLSLDSGVGQFIGSILCDSGEGGGKNSSRVQTAACIADILSKCGMNPLNKTLAQSSKWQCALASTLAASALEVLKESASNYTYLQCVGFVRAIDVANGGPGSGFGDAKTLLTSPPSGYKPVLGVGSCSAGDFFVDTTTGGYGHTGVFIAYGGSTCQVADANGSGSGVVRGPGSGTWLCSRIAGCLKKI